MRVEKARRIAQLPPYLFAEIDRKKTALRKKGMDLIDRIYEVTEALPGQDKLPCNC